LLFRDFRIPSFNPARRDSRFQRGAIDCSPFPKLLFTQLAQDRRKTVTRKSEVFSEPKPSFFRPIFLPPLAGREGNNPAAGEQWVFAGRALRPPFRGAPSRKALRGDFHERVAALDRRMRLSRRHDRRPDQRFSQSAPQDRPDRRPAQPAGGTVVNLTLYKPMTIKRGFCATGASSPVGRVQKAEGNRTA